MEKKKDVRLQARISANTGAKLAELQRLLSARMGTDVSKTAAIEVAIDWALEQFKARRDQARLI